MNSLMERYSFFLTYTFRLRWVLAHIQLVFGATVLPEEPEEMTRHFFPIKQCLVIVHKPVRYSPRLSLSRDFPFIA